MDPARRRALSDFYREEFNRHLQYLQSSGIVDSDSHEAVHRAYRRFETDLERLCVEADFSMVAETVLQRFDTLTRLSKLDLPKSH